MSKQGLTECQSTWGQQIAKIFTLFHKNIFSKDLEQGWVALLHVHTAEHLLELLGQILQSFLLLTFLGGIQKDVKLGLLHVSLASGVYRLIVVQFVQLGRSLPPEEVFGPSNIYQGHCYIDRHIINKASQLAFNE